MSSQYKPLPSAFCLVDERGLRAMNRHPPFDIAGYFEPKLSALIARCVRDNAFAHGIVRKAFAKILGEQVVAYFGASPAEVARHLGLADVHALNRALLETGAEATTFGRVAGSIDGLSGVGVLRYKIVSVADERTRPACGLLDKQVLLVAEAMTHIETWRSAATPAEARRAHPWPTEAAVRKCIKASGLAAPSRVSPWSSERIMLPPFAPLCRCSIAISY